jgi:HD superfamily phosphodiesterase
MPNSRKEAFELIDELGAPEHLKTHVTLVGEAADLLIEAIGSLGIELDFEFVRTGVVIHDIGKTVHINEMTGPGSEHEPEGEKIVGICLLNSITNSKKLLRVGTRGCSEV